MWIFVCGSFMLLSDVGGAGADTASGHKCHASTETETEGPSGVPGISRVRAVPGITLQQTRTLGKA